MDTITKVFPPSPPPTHRNIEWNKLRILAFVLGRAVLGRNWEIVHVVKWQSMSRGVFWDVVSLVHRSPKRTAGPMPVPTNRFPLAPKHSHTWPRKDLSEHYSLLLISSSFSMYLVILLPTREEHKLGNTSWLKAGFNLKLPCTQLLMMASKEALLTTKRLKMYCLSCCFCPARPPRNTCGSLPCPHFALSTSQATMRDATGPQWYAQLGWDPSLHSHHLTPQPLPPHAVLQRADQNLCFS